jgi:signal transduction histidine kinase
VERLRGAPIRLGAPRLALSDLPAQTAGEPGDGRDEDPDRHRRECLREVAERVVGGQPVVGGEDVEPWAMRAEAEQESRAEQARLAERARIAREMHDVLAHKVSLIAMHAGALEMQRVPDPEQVARTAGLIRTTAREAMEDLRDVLGVLRADTVDLAPPPRRDDIARVVDASRAAGVQAELRMDVDELPDGLARTAHRIVQEGLTNVHKHARGRRPR